MKRTIQIEYSCKLCGITRRKLNVPERDGEDVKDWMDQTVLKIADDHFVLSPFCRAKEISEVWIPIFDEAAPIGTSKN